MRVLHVISLLAAAHGGPTAALMGLTRAQHRAGLNPRILSTYRPQDSSADADQLRSEGIPVEWVGPCRGPLLWSPSIVPALRSAIAQADIVHIHALWESVQHNAAVESRRAGKPYIFRPCGMLDPWSLKQGGLKKRFYLRLRLMKDFHRAAAMHYTTEVERDNAIALAIKSPSIVMPNGVDLSDFADPPLRSAFRDKHPRIGDKPMVLIFGRVDAKKGFDLLIPAFAKIQPQDAQLVIAGPDLENYTPTIQAMIDKAGLRERVHFTGMLRGRERVEALAAAELFVLPSYQENFGVSVIEALAAGCPVILSDQVALHRQTTAAGVGATVPLDVNTLASTLTHWLTHPDVRHAAAAKAKPWVQSHFDWDTIAVSWSERYHRLLHATA